MVQDPSSSLVVLFYAAMRWGLLSPTSIRYTHRMKFRRVTNTSLLIGYRCDGQQHYGGKHLRHPYR